METENSESENLSRLMAFKEMMGIVQEAVNSCKAILSITRDVYKEQVLKKATKNWEEHSEWNKTMEAQEKELASAYQNLNYWTKLFTGLLKTLKSEEVPQNFLPEYTRLIQEPTASIPRISW